MRRQPTVISHNREKMLLKGVIRNILFHLRPYFFSPMLLFLLTYFNASNFIRANPTNWRKPCQYYRDIYLLLVFFLSNEEG